MSRLRTNIITNRMANGAPTVSNGLVISGVTTTSDIKVGTGATLNVYGGATFSGIVTATSFVGDGSNLSNITTTTINNNADNRVITGSGTANTLNGESGLVYNGYNLAISGTGQQQLNLGSTNAGGVAIILDGDSNGDAAGGDYSIIRHNTDGDLEFFARNPAGATNTIFRQGTSEKVRIDASGNMNVTGILTATNLVSNQPFSHRNKLYNGDMRISQRGDAHTNVGNNASTYTLDRWKLYVQNTPARFQVERNYDHSLPDGFQTSMRISCTTTDTSLAATDEVYLQQSIEGQDLMAFAKGTSSAKQYTLSFYARSDKTGTYIVRLLGRDNTTSNVSAAYTMTNTWTRHVITFPADTNSSRKDNPDNGEGLRVMWWLVAGSGVNNGTLQTTWVNSTDTGRATGQVNFADNNSNRDFYITGCQLEAGPVATPFEYIPYPEQLSRCKRYFQKFTAYGDHHHFGVARAESNTARTGLVIPVPMRAVPTVACNGSRTFRGDGGYNSQSTDTPAFPYSAAGWDSNSNIYTVDFPGHSLNHNQMYCLMSVTTSTNALTLESEF